MPPFLMNLPVTVKRRVSTGTDTFGNPIYGDPTDGSGWSTIYTNMMVRLAFSSKALQFAQSGERPTPNGIVYYQSSYTLQQEDRILTPDGIEYIVTSIVPGYLVGNSISHYEAIVSLP